MVGLGRLGICTALVFEKAGWDVLGADVIQSYVDKINSKTLASGEPRVEELLKASTKLRATTSLAEVAAFSDVIFVLVATPTGTAADQAYDCGTLSKVLSDLNDLRLENKHVVINCTVMPGYIDNVAKHLLRDCANTTISYNPEFIAQGNVVAGLLRPDMVLIGEGSPLAGEILEGMYRSVTENSPHVCRMSQSSAEITKLAVNCFITTKIAYCNMVSEICDRTANANKFDVLKAVGFDERIGSQCLLPGYGFGGPCFPRDNRALGHHARNVGVQPLVSEATDKFNVLHADFMAAELLKQGKDHYVVEDVAYKPKCPVDIIEESQPLEVAKRLVRAGKRVTIRDRSGIVELTRRTYGSMFEYESTDAPEGGSPSKRAKPNPDSGNPMSSYRR